MLFLHPLFNLLSLVFKFVLPFDLTHQLIRTLILPELIEFLEAFIPLSVVDRRQKVLDDPILPVVQGSLSLLLVLLILCVVHI